MNDTSNIVDRKITLYNYLCQKLGVSKTLPIEEGMNQILERIDKMEQIVTVNSEKELEDIKDQYEELKFLISVEKKAQNEVNDEKITNEFIRMTNKNHEQRQIKEALSFYSDDDEQELKRNSKRKFKVSKQDSKKFDFKKTIGMIIKTLVKIGIIGVCCAVLIKGGADIGNKIEQKIKYYQKSDEATTFITYEVPADGSSKESLRNKGFYDIVVVEREEGGPSLGNKLSENPDYLGAGDKLVARVDENLAFELILDGKTYIITFDEYSDYIDQAGAKVPDSAVKIAENSKSSGKVM